MKSSREPNGFTFIEVMVSAVIMSVLLLAVSAAMRVAVSRARWFGGSTRGQYQLMAVGERFGRDTRGALACEQGLVSGGAQELYMTFPLPEQLVARADPEGSGFFIRYCVRDNSLVREEGCVSFLDDAKESQVIHDVLCSHIENMSVSYLAHIPSQDEEEIWQPVWQDKDDKPVKIKLAITRVTAWSRNEYEKTVTMPGYISAR